ncbi:hypothetical protein EQT97_06220 [Fructilactobacillus sanfranciscensis]|nr:hypothetical protein [Fructilactobacillus sanfranciscensis]NDR77711.1 hypothetical protein [Fructilactobacillus sanfranciscensis]
MGVLLHSHLELLGISRWYHHEQRVDRLNAREASGQSAFSYDDFKGLRKLAFWLFVFSIFLNWGMLFDIMFLAWLTMWIISIFF